MAKTKKPQVVKPAKATTIPDANKIVSQIIRLSYNRAEKDIGTWTGARGAAEDVLTPNRTQLYDLYHDLKLDGHYRMVRKQLISFVLGGKFQILDGETFKVDKDLTRLFEKKWFKELRTQKVDSILEGLRLLQFNRLDPREQKIEMELVPPKHVIPGRGEWTVWQTDYKGVNYRDDPKAMQWLLEVGDKDDLGELNPCAPYILFKKNAFQCWSEFAEKFGMPLAKAKVNAKDLKAVNRMEQFLINMGSSSYAIIDQGEEIEFVENAKSDAYMVYDKLIERCNSEISKMILMQVMANDIGAHGSRAQSQTHGDRNEEIKEALRSAVEDLVNEELLDLLAIHGFNTKGKIGRYVRSVKLSKEELEFDKFLFKSFNIDEEWWEEKYNIPMNGFKKAVTDSMTGQPEDPEEIDPEETDPEEEAEGATPKAKFKRRGKKVTNATQVLLKEFLELPFVQQVKMHSDIQAIYKECNHQ